MKKIIASAAVCSLLSIFISLISIYAINIGQTHHLNTVIQLFDWKYIVILIPGILIGVKIGVHSLSFVNTKLLRMFFVVLMAAMSLHMFGVY